MFGGLPFFFAFFDVQYNTLTKKSQSPPTVNLGWLGVQKRKRNENNIYIKMKKQINAINQGKLERIKLFQIKNKAFFSQKGGYLKGRKKCKKESVWN